MHYLLRFKNQPDARIGKARHRFIAVFSDKYAVRFESREEAENQARAIEESERLKPGCLEVLDTH